MKEYARKLESALTMRGKVNEVDYVKAKNENIMLKEENMKLLELIEELKRENQIAAKTPINTLEDGNQLKGKLKESCIEFEKIQTEMHNLMIEKNSFQESTRELTKERAELLKKIDENKIMMKKITDQNQDLLKDKQEEINRLQEDLEEAMKEIEYTRSEYQTKMHDMISPEKYNELAEQNKALQANISDKQIEMQKLQQEIAQKISHEKEQSQINSDLRNEYAKIKEKLIECEKKYEDQIDKLEKAKKSHKEEIDKVYNELSSAKKENTKLKKTLSETVSKLQEAALSTNLFSQKRSINAAYENYSSLPLKPIDNEEEKDHIIVPSILVSKQLGNLVEGTVELPVSTIGSHTNPLNIIAGKELSQQPVQMLKTIIENSSNMDSIESKYTEERLKNQALLEEIKKKKVVGGIKEKLF